MKGFNPKLYSMILIGLMAVSGLLYVLFALEVMGETLLINWGYFLFAIAIIVSLVFPAISMAKNFTKAKNSLIGIGVLIVIFVIGYAMSSDEVYKIGDSVVEGASSKRSEAGLITFYVMIVLAIGVIVYTEISKAFK